jgi:hypothetical protein
MMAVCAVYNVLFRLLATLCVVLNSWLVSFVPLVQLFVNGQTLDGVQSVGAPNVQDMS